MHEDRSLSSSGAHLRRKRAQPEPLRPPEGGDRQRQQAPDVDHREGALREGAGDQICEPGCAKFEGGWAKGGASEALVIKSAGVAMRGRRRPREGEEEGGAGEGRRRLEIR